MKSNALYLWFMLPRPLKRPEWQGTSDIRRLVNVLGSVLDDTKDLVLSIRRSWLTPTSWGAFLDLIGDSRLLPRHPGESDGTYKSRLISAFELYQKGGTNWGVFLGTSLLGYEDFAITEPRIQCRYDGRQRYDGSLRYDGLLWAFFTVSITMPPTWTAMQHAVLVDTINRWKSAHVRLDAVNLQAGDWSDTFPTATDELVWVVERSVATSDAYPWPVAMYNGQHQYDGSIQYGGGLDTLVMEFQHP